MEMYLEITEEQAYWLKERVLIQIAEMVESMSEYDMEEIDDWIHFYTKVQDAVEFEERQKAKKVEPPQVDDDGTV